MPTDAFEMAIVHRVFRNELRNAPGLIREVEAGDTERSAIVGGHLDFIAAALHHHHAAEDELIWPKLHARAPARAAEITRMEGAHRGIADSVATVQAMLPSWATSADARQAGQLVAGGSRSRSGVLVQEEREVGTCAGRLRPRRCVSRRGATLPGRCAAAAAHAVAPVRKAHFRRLPGQALRRRRSSADLTHGAKSP